MKSVWLQSLDLVSLVDFVGEFGVWILALPSIVICDSVMGLYLLDIRPRVKPEGETPIWIMILPEGEARGRNSDMDYDFT